MKFVPETIADLAASSADVRLLCNLYRRASGQGPLVAGDPVEARIVDDMQSALSALVADEEPRMEEPGLWGVVEASCVHDDSRRKWVGHEDDHWWPADEYGRTAVDRPRLPDDWDSLVDPALVRDGIDGPGA